jgi:hypothetical protein
MSGSYQISAAKRDSGLKKVLPCSFSGWNAIGAWHFTLLRAPIILAFRRGFSYKILLRWTVVAPLARSADDSKSLTNGV